VRRTRGGLLRTAEAKDESSGFFFLPLYKLYDSKIVQYGGFGFTALMWNSFSAPGCLSLIGGGHMYCLELALHLLRMLLGREVDPVGVYFVNPCTVNPTPYLLVDHHRRLAYLPYATPAHDPMCSLPPPKSSPPRCSNQSSSSSELSSSLSCIDVFLSIASSRDLNSWILASLTTRVLSSRSSMMKAWPLS
jgi:hypothetical protein